MQNNHKEKLFFYGVQLYAQKVRFCKVNFVDTTT